VQSAEALTTLFHRSTTLSKSVKFLVARRYQVPQYVPVAHNRNRNKRLFASCLERSSGFLRFAEGVAGFFVLEWSDCLRAIALLGHVLHQGFRDCLAMSTREFFKLCREAEKIAKSWGKR
jgi:hypothetical protein